MLYTYCINMNFFSDGILRNMQKKRLFQFEKLWHSLRLPNSANVISSKMTSTSRHEKLAINCPNCRTLIMIQKNVECFTSVNLIIVSFRTYYQSLNKNFFRLLLNYCYYVPYLDKRHAYMYAVYESQVRNT